ncbi:Deoxynucleotidyltransferase terminal-interacting protein 2 [Thelohanellus kitauei]|uniref:Deoxynucleotidyltransferase terminal-interacting protein 2 n=1 Tax=Thelohanellus kitauei TaxID=669202 RepID=A0A0C2M4J2_THEKT|nr:Deoxynucleotidyltransferase terminal-interacting protein 2 [Thelohanellus kitauei]
MSTFKLPGDLEKLHTVPPFKVSKYKMKRERKKLAQQTSGPGWYNMPAIKDLPQVKKDLQLLKLRQSIDPGSRYKKLDWDKNKKILQVFLIVNKIGTIVSTPFDHFDNITKKNRKNTLIEQLLDNENARRLSI